MSLEGTLDVTVTDDMVEFAFTVTNTGTEDADLTFPNSLMADFAVVESDEEHWRWSDGRMFTQMIQNESIPAGSAETYEGAWTTPVSGHYDAVAELKANDVDLTVTESFSV